MFILIKVYTNLKWWINKNIQLTNRKITSTVLYAGDQIQIATSGDAIQIMAYHLKLTARKHKMQISSTKTNSLATCVINDKYIENVSDFKYLECFISDYKSDLEGTLQLYNKISVIMLIHFGKQMPKEKKN